MPRTILFLSSMPRDMAPLRVPEEVREIQDAIRRTRYRDKYQMVVHLSMRASDMHRVLMEHRPAIVHYSGHGRGERGVVLEDERGDSLLVSNLDFARMLGHFHNEIECVLMNCCQSEAQINVMAEQFPYAIGMEHALDDRAAIRFAVVFYECLLNGEDIPSAYDIACSAVCLDGLAIGRIAVLARGRHGHAGPPLPGSRNKRPGRTERTQEAASPAGGTAGANAGARPFGALHIFITIAACLAGVATVMATAIALVRGDKEQSASLPDSFQISHVALTDTAPMRFVQLPGGEFTMGSPESEVGRDLDEVPHRVSVSAFEIAETEVTQAQWEAVMGENPSRDAAGRGNDRAVQNLSWVDAITFLNRLSLREKRSACYTVNEQDVVWDLACDGYRLPTEAEWELACRAGVNSRYSFGDDESGLMTHCMVRCGLCRKGSCRGSQDAQQLGAI